MRTDLEKVERNLAQWQGLISGQRHSVPAGATEVAWVDARPGLMEQIKTASTARDRRLAELMELYGDAVARVPGAVDEDLVILDGMGLLLVDLPDDF